MVRTNLVGRVVGGKYRVTSVVGEGGMGIVYEAEHVAIGKPVALKVLNRIHIGRRDAIARFHREARAAGSIGHPNICEVFDVGRLPDGTPYMVMERLQGVTLSDRIRSDGAQQVRPVIDILAQVLSALGAAHTKGIIHRDIKPENIFLAERGEGVRVVKILDFGIAKSTHQNAEHSLTLVGMVVGTPYYMAPEQARGASIDHRVDLYACGVILFESLTGKLPFYEQNHHEVMKQILTKPPPDPREYCPTIPFEVLPILFTSLSKDPDNRFQSADAFRDALIKLTKQLEEEGAGKAARAVAPAGRAPRPSARPRKAAEHPTPDKSNEEPVAKPDVGAGKQALKKDEEPTLSLPLEVLERLKKEAAQPAPIDGEPRKKPSKPRSDRPSRRAEWDEATIKTTFEAWDEIQQDDDLITSRMKHRPKSKPPQSSEDESEADPGSFSALPKIRPLLVSEPDDDAETRVFVPSTSSTRDTAVDDHDADQPTAETDEPGTPTKAKRARKRRR